MGGGCTGLPMGVATVGWGWGGATGRWGGNSGGGVSSGVGVRGGVFNL